MFLLKLLLVHKYLKSRTDSFLPFKNELYSTAL